MAQFLPDILAFFFITALIAQRFSVDLKLPDAAYQLITYILLITIGLKGGQAIAANASLTLIGQSSLVIFMGLLITAVALALIKFGSTLNKTDSVTLAAHYGSVSVGTFAVAVSFLEVNNIDYELTLNLFVALLELPAIILGLYLLSDKQHKLNVKTILAHKSLALIVIGMLIGALYGEESTPMTNNLKPMFSVMLALYLVHMGALAGNKISDIGPNKFFIIAFGVVMPMIGASIALLVAWLINLSHGGAALLAVLGASASYIAVPAVFEQAHPKANVAQALFASLAISFSFNVIWGIEWYTKAAQYITAL
ncbi:sodium-dependent bicarbonate transport family permease [Colwellia sp. UCD-KL20]|uniref:sodium-dependent bicarbonate transport family permease n=1 Tax=Colwellia sp. UCD-KL20 TaxID=1917165 RepID=UPI0009708DCB|nr:sodium-dependent bicarbonate transport family permease [Colwellia sp. UCD-KL20]